MCRVAAGRRVFHRTLDAAAFLNHHAASPKPFSCLACACLHVLLTVSLLADLAGFAGSVLVHSFLHSLFACRPWCPQSLRFRNILGCSLTLGWSRKWRKPMVPGDPEADSSLLPQRGHGARDLRALAMSPQSHRSSLKQAVSCSIADIVQCQQSSCIGKLARMPHLPQLAMGPWLPCK